MIFTSDEWPGAFGSVTFKLHEGRHNGRPIYFIRTDASESTFAEENKLVFVPLLNAGRDVAASLYLFDGDRPPVLSASPGDEENFTSLFHIKNVSGGDGLDSAEAVEAAYGVGVTIEELDIAGLDAALEAKAKTLGRRAAQKLASSGYRGWLDVDLVACPEGGLHITEVNTRTRAI